MDNNTRTQDRRVIRGALFGMLGTFVFFAGAILAFGEAWTSAAGAAAVPTLFGGWYFGALIPLSKLDFSGLPLQPKTVATPDRARTGTNDDLPHPLAGEHATLPEPVAPAA